MKGRIIYEPNGKAREYSDLAINLFTGCPHGCLYCYGPMTLKKVDYFETIQLKMNALERLAKDAKKLAGDPRSILVSFVTDPYMPEEFEQGITRQAIQILMEHDLTFSILTKGGTRAVRDFDLLAQAKASFGTTLIFTDQASADHWEPHAPTIQDRIKAIQTAHNLGIKTWVSLEPVIYPD